MAKVVICGYIPAPERVRETGPISNCFERAYGPIDSWLDGLRHEFGVETCIIDLDDNRLDVMVELPAITPKFIEAIPQDFLREINLEAGDIVQYGEYLSGNTPALNFVLNINEVSLADFMRSARNFCPDEEVFVIDPMKCKIIPGHIVGSIKKVSLRGGGEGFAYDVETGRGGVQEIETRFIISAEELYDITSLYLDL